jgi:hypothetical protein
MELLIAYRVAVFEQIRAMCRNSCPSKGVQK